MQTDTLHSKVVYHCLFGRGVILASNEGSVYVKFYDYNKVVELPLNVLQKVI